MEEFIRITLLKVPPILLALTVHECAHAWVATRLGDHTARMLGRVTLNPVKHLDPIGTIVLFLSGMFGWAKPVPVNPLNFRDPSRGMMWVSVAGPGANLFLAAVFALIYRLLNIGGYTLSVMGSPVLGPLFIMIKFSIIINVSLAIFNMIPVPPLDGSKVLSHFLAADKALGYARIEPYGFLILMVLIVTGIVGKILSPIVLYTVNLLVWGGV